MEALIEGDAGKRQVDTLSRLSLLPVFNQYALKLLTVATDSDSAIEEFEAAFRSDPALAADLLVLANSAQFGFRSQVTSVGHALTLIGLEQARALACMIAVSFYLRRSTSPDVSTSWKHSIATAAIAGHMAHLSSSSPSLLHTAALLHDIGSLGLQLTSRKEYHTLTELKLTEIHEVLHFERMLFGMNHCEAGAALARTWRFPESLAHQIGAHHEPANPHDDPVTILVQAACRMAEVLGYPESALAPGAVRLQLEAVTPQRFRGSPAFNADRLIAIVNASLESAAGLAV